MKKIIYHSKIANIGQFATDSLNDGFIITFMEGSPSDLSDYCYLIEKANLVENISSGNILELGEFKYIVTAAGKVASQNLADLGHVTISFSATNTAELPGTIYVSGNAPAHINVGDKFQIYTINEE